MAVNHLVSGSNPDMPANADAVERANFAFTTWVSCSGPAYIVHWVKPLSLVALFFNNGYVAQ